MRHDGDNTLKFQENYDDLRALPHNPMESGVFHYFVGIHLLVAPGHWPVVLNLTEEHINLLKLLGKSYMQLYDVEYS